MEYYIKGDKFSFLKSLQLSLYASQKTLVSLFEIKQQILKTFYEYENEADLNTTDKMKRYLLSTHKETKTKNIEITKYLFLRFMADDESFPLSQVKFIMRLAATAFNCIINVYKKNSENDYLEKTYKYQS